MLKLELENEGKVRKYKGKTVADIFGAFEKDLFKLKAKSVLRFQVEDGRIKEYPLFPRKIKQLLTNKLSRILYAKRLSLLMGIKVK